jgi:ABC-type polysaccharide/polyol phosphate export permease
MASRPLTATAPHLDARGLLWTLVRTDFKVRYHRTWLGFLWALLKPISLLLVLLAIFSSVFPGEPDFRLNLVLSLFLWDFFAESTKVGVISLQAKGFLIAKTNLPRWIVVVTSISNPLITLAIYSVIMMVVLAVAGRPPSLPALALLLFYIAQLCAISIGISLAGSVLFLRFRDVNQIWEVITSAGFFLTPIVFPIGVLPHRYHLLLYAWPPTPIIMFARATLVARAPPSLRAHLLLLAMALFILGAGAAIYRRQAPSIAERL